MRSVCGNVRIRRQGIGSTQENRKINEPLTLFLAKNMFVLKKQKLITILRKITGDASEVMKKLDFMISVKYAINKNHREYMKVLKHIKVRNVGKDTMNFFLQE